MNEPSDGLTKVHLELPNHWWFKGESLWAKDLGNDLYEIQNVPFCAYGLNCGDVVRATADAPELKPEVREVVRRSGNQTLRVSFNVNKEQQHAHVEAIESTGAWVERANPSFICINVPPESNYGKVRQYLEQLEASGALEYETCEERVPGSFDDNPQEQGGGDD
ncbi:MAG: DUF4265 domain-containing protein [Hylemonella sp.]|uniref:DUF4265 domain-containing protein n=1 Tax=Hylemonella sp. TaxID=2066020 RepID=UPI0022C52BD6|nr:DUF4265 domain-containing protein [Hylemonella sp.]MCZ8253055.1 DUF4265 domain-containing protein [Hylemonella sp.]